MSNATVKLTGSGAFQDIGTISTSTSGLAGNMQSVNQILDVGLRNTSNIKDSFLRVSDLTGLGLATLNGNVLTVADLTSSTSSFSVNGTSGITGLVFSGATVSVSGGIATITVMGGGGGTGTVTSVGITSSTLTVSGTVTTMGNLTVNLSSGQVSDLALAATALQPVGGLAGSYTNTNLTINSSGQITAAANGTGGGGGSTSFNITPDTHPAIPTGVGLGPNDEFEYGSTVDTAGTRYSGATSWTIINPSPSSTINLANGALHINAPVDGSAGGDNLRIVRAIEQASPTPSWRFQTKIRAIQPHTYNIAGFWFRNSSTAAYFCLIHHNSGIGQTYIGTQTWPVMTGYSDVFLDNNLLVDNGLTAETKFVYLEIEYTGGTLYFRMSMNGIQFVQVYSATDTALLGGAVTNIGLTCLSISSAAAADGIFDWFRRVA